MGGGTLVQFPHEGDTVPRLDSCVRTESTSLLIPGLPVLFPSNQILLSLVLWDIPSFNTCQRKLIVSFSPPAFRREINSKYPDLSPDAAFSRKTETRKWQCQIQKMPIRLSRYISVSDVGWQIPGQIMVERADASGTGLRGKEAPFPSLTANPLYCSLSVGHRIALCSSYVPESPLELYHSTVTLHAHNLLLTMGGLQGKT